MSYPDAKKPGTMTDGSFLSPSPVADPVSLAEHERAYADLADAVRELIDATVRTRIAVADAGTVAADVRAITQELLATAQRKATELAALDQKDLAAARRWLQDVAGSHRGRALYRLGFAEFEAVLVRLAASGPRSALRARASRCVACWISSCQRSTIPVSACRRMPASIAGFRPVPG